MFLCRHWNRTPRTGLSRRRLEQRTQPPAPSAENTGDTRMDIHVRHSSNACSLGAGFPVPDCPLNSYYFGGYRRLFGRKPAAPEGEDEPPVLPRAPNAVVQEKPASPVGA